MRKLYDKEFKAGVLAVVRQGEVPLRQVAADFGISITCLQMWLRADRQVGGDVSPEQSVSLMEQLKELEKRNKLLEQEVEVFRRADAYMAQLALDNPKGFTH